MLKKIETEIASYESKLRATPINVVNVDGVSPEMIVDAFRPIIQIPIYGANRRPIMETELVPLMAHFANLHGQIGELLGIMSHRVRHLEIMGERENAKTARTKREMFEELRKDIKVNWDTIRSIAFGQQSYLKMPE